MAEPPGGHFVVEDDPALSRRQSGGTSFDDRIVLGLIGEDAHCDNTIDAIRKVVIDSR